MPYGSNPLFVGRADYLKQLAAALKTGQTTAISQTAITGLGGIGKTQLAIAFAHCYGHYFAGSVFWLSMADAANVPTEIALCGGTKGMDLIANFVDLPLEQQVDMVMTKWQEPIPRLLIFDNCEDEELLAQWRPKHGGCRVLVTSRRGSWDAGLGVINVPLGILGRAESMALIQKLADHVSAEGADKIAEELGDLPLALHLAGSYLGRYRSQTVEQYLNQLKDKGLLEHPSLQGRGSSYSPTGHERHVARTFALSFERLDKADEVDALAIKLLARAAYFAPGEPILADLLLATVVDEAGGDNLIAEDALIRLVELGLLTESDQGQLATSDLESSDTIAYQLHRLIAKFVQGLVLDKDALTAVEKAVLERANSENAAGYPGELLLWQPQLRHVTDSAKEQETEHAAVLCNTLAYHLQSVADYVGARSYYEQSLAILENMSEPRHHDTATSLNNLGLLLQVMGDYADARPYYERALAIFKNERGLEHPDTASSLNNLGLLLQAMGDYPSARLFYQQALDIREKVLGMEHPHTAQSLNNLGLLLQAIGDYSGALPYIRQALTIREKVLGSEHPDTAQSLNNLGYLFRVTGDQVKARSYYEQALTIRENVLGPEHPDTARSLNNLGYLLDSMGDYEGARTYYERALTIREKVLGPEHPDTAQSLNNLGCLLDSMGDYEGARTYYERALTIREKVLGPEHPHTANCLNNLGFLLDSMGDYEGARPYYEQAFAIREKVLGPEHPDTAQSLNNLAILCYSEGNLAESVQFMRQALAIWEKVLGPNHQNTVSSRESLTVIEEELNTTP